MIDAATGANKYPNGANIIADKKNSCRVGGTQR